MRARWGGAEVGRAGVGERVVVEKVLAGEAPAEVLLHAGHPPELSAARERGSPLIIKIQVSSGELAGLTRVRGEVQAAAVGANFLGDRVEIGLSSPSGRVFSQPRRARLSPSYQLTNQPQASLTPQPRLIETTRPRPRPRPRPRFLFRARQDATPSRTQRPLGTSNQPGLPWQSTTVLALLLTM